MAIIIPGILTNDEKDYQQKLKKAEGVADLIQIDVIDGIFANNITVGTDVIKKNPTSAMLEIQLMVIEPKKYLIQLVSLQFVSRIIIPFETNNLLRETIYQIKNNQKQVGISLNPQTPINAASNLFTEIDLLSLYAGTPGFSGQKFQKHILQKIRQSKDMMPNLPVEVDIGVNFQTASEIAEAGADFLVATSALHNAPDFQLAYQKLAKLASNLQ